MINPFTPRRPSTPAAPAARVVARQIGVTDEGAPILAYRDETSVQQPAPLVYRPWGAYAAGGCGALLALCVAALVVLALVLGFAIALMAIALCAVALTICLLILRSVWRDYARSNTPHD